MRIPLLFLTFLVPLHAAEDRFKFDEHQPVSRTFNVTTAGSGAAKLLVDNVSGFIHVTGYSGSEVKLSADLRYRAESPEALAEAKRDVKLDMNQQGNFARVYLDGPFRNNNHRGDRYYGYQVEVTFEIQVPLATEVILKTVNGGPLILKNTSGDFDVSNVNGAISLDQVSGSGSVHTVNGAVTARFARNPTRATSFRSVNGPLDMYLHAPLSADIKVHTVNGQLYSDFDIAPLASPAPEAEQQNGRFVYRANRMTHGRAGTGGPELSFDVVNGSIRLHKI